MMIATMCQHPKCQDGRTGPVQCLEVLEQLQALDARQPRIVTAHRLLDLMIVFESEERIARISGRVDSWADDCRDALHALRELRRRRLADPSQLEIDQQLLGQLGEG